MKFGKLQRKDQDYHLLMVILESLHIIWMTVCVEWLAGHVTEMVQSGVVVEAQMSTQSVQKLRKNDQEERTQDFLQ